MSNMGRLGFHEVVPSPPTSPPGRNARGLASSQRDLSTRLYASASTLNKLAGVPSVALEAMKTGPPSPRKVQHRVGTSSTSSVLGRTALTNPRWEPPSAPASGSMVSSGQIAPRMKLVRRASRDLSADVEAAGGDPSTLQQSQSRFTTLGQFQSEGEAGRVAGGAARSRLIAGLKKRERQQYPWRSSTNGAEGDRRINGLSKAPRFAHIVSNDRLCNMDTPREDMQRHTSEIKIDTVPHGGFIKSLKASPLWKDPFRNPNVFLYLTPDTDNPYKLTIVDSLEPSSDKFYTLSMNGLVCSTRDRTEFVTVEQFERQYMQYHRISALPFFRQYSRWKSFAEWKSFVRIRKRAKCRAVLEEGLFTLHPWLRIGIRRLKELCHELSTHRAFKVDGGTHTLEEFCGAQSIQRDHLELELQRFSLNVREAVMKSCEDTLYNFLHKAGFNVKASSPEEARELLIKTMEEVNPSEISFTERAAMRTQCRKLAKFMKVAEFLVADTYFDVALESTRDLLGAVQHAVDSTSDTEVRNLRSVKEESTQSSEKPPEPSCHSGGGTLKSIRLPLFVVEISYVEGAEELATSSKHASVDPSELIVVNPSEEEFHTRLEMMLFDGLTVLVNPHRLLSEPSFKAFVSPIIDERGTFGEGKDLEAAIMEDSDFQEMLESIHRNVAHSFRRTETYASSFDTLTQCFLENAKFARDMSISCYVNANVEQLKALLFNYDDQTTRFKRIKTLQDVGLIRVGSTKLEAMLRPSPERCLDMVHQVVPQLYKINHELLLNELSKSLDALSKKSRSVEDFANLIIQYRGAKERAGDMQERYTFLASLYEVMEGNGVTITDDTRTAANMIVKLRKQLQTKIEMVETIYDQEHQKFSSELGKQAASLTPRIQALRMDLGHGMIQNPTADVAEVIEYLVTCEKTLASLYTLADCLISWQTTLQTGSFDRDELEEIESEMSQKTRLWRGIQTFEERLETWESTSFQSLDIDAMETEIVRFWRIVQMSEKQLPANPAVGRLKHMVEEVKLTVPVVADLRNGTLTDKHWELLDKILDVDIRRQETVTFKKMMEANLKNVSDQVNSVVTNAEQEANLNRQFHKVQGAWADATFQLKSHAQKKDVVILSDVDDLTTLVDDSVVTMGNILASPHVGPIRPQAEEFGAKLRLLQATLEEWLVLQRTWGYISSIFAAPDIQKQLPGEARAFRTVDTFFKDTMKKTAEDPHCLTAGTAPGLMDSFKRNNEALEGIAKGLDTFLEVKRQAFPRFYFLADDELLDLLSRCRDTSAVQPHLQKCFDAVHSLEFGDGPSSNTINAMVSREGESVALGPNLKARGALEDWLTAIEDNMRKVLHRFIKVALTELEGINFDGGLGRVRTKRPSRNVQNTAEARVVWALDGQPAQVIATVVQICWTRATEQAMSREMEGESGVLQAWLETSVTGLHALVGRIQEKITPLQRTLAVALVTAEVHNRDVLEILVNKDVHDPQNFLWQAQLRFYWDADTVRAQQSTARVQYGFEYQGATTRLVITPLTERCWMTITGALDLKLGANPIGPAGTGKTESTKDLAKGLGTQCIVFNCSDQIDHTMPARLLSGLVQTGAWTCLDEFNRINIEVLSVVAEQLMVLRNARLAGATTVVFEGRGMPLLDHHVVVTMNPGYSGRTELPNNLQTCFRPVAMMVPDYSLISEIILYSEGFEHAKELSAKVSTLARLCSEQLSQQPHYDFGMRAVKSILVFAGQAKRQQKREAVESEEDVLIQALCSSNLPKLLERDTPLFKAILGDLFPRRALPTPAHDDLHRGVAAAAKKLGLQPLKEQTMKVNQLHETIEVRFGVALVGHAGSGKTSILRLLAEGSTWLRNEELQQIEKSHQTTLQHGNLDGGKTATSKLADTVLASGDDTWLPPARNLEDAKILSEGQNVEDSEEQLQTKWPQTIVDVVNPKAISVGELYGQFNPFSMEWRDGVGSSLMRKAATMTPKVSKERWIVFDGPIDVVWIESMNTALDDNLTLCLASGERVKLKPDSMHLLFEVDDLLQASPATVSRLGVVYVQRSCVSSSSIFRTWLDGPTLGVLLSGTYASQVHKLKMRLSELAKKLMWPTLAYMSGRGDAVFREEVVTLQVQRVQSFCVLFEGILSRQRDLHARAAEVAAEQAAKEMPVSPRKGAHDISPKEPADVCGHDSAFGGAGTVDAGFAPSPAVIDQTFLFAMIWGLGGGLTGDPALALDVYIRDLVQTSGLYNSIGLPPTGSVFEYYVHFYPPGQGGVRPYEWRSWAADVPSFVYPLNVPVYEMMVPTANTECYSFLLETNLVSGRPTFLAGASGAGKTMLAAQLFQRHSHLRCSSPAAAAVIKDSDVSSRPSSPGGARRRTLLLDEDCDLCPEWRSSDLLHFSAQPVIVSMHARSSSQGVQASLESKMVTVHKDLLGAPEGKTNVIFVDDVNLPARDAFDSQPPVELLRQLVSEGGFYDRERLFWRSVIDTVVVVAAAPPGGARSAPSARFSRLFSVLNLPIQSTASNNVIFGSILQGFLATGFLTAVANLSDSLVSATLEVYCKVEREMLPTPSRPHYTFNLRDISKVVQGILMVKHQSVQAPAGMVRLWMHEMSRVFGDRLADTSHRVMFEHMLVEAVGRHFKMAGPGWRRDDLFEMRDPKPGEDYSQGESLLLFGDVLGTGTVASERLYEECSDLRRVVRQLSYYQDEYNIGGNGAEMSLVLFPDAVRHLLRISRILRQPRGNAILIGLAGSGRESLTHLAASMAGSMLVRVNVTHDYGVQKFEQDLKKAVLAAGIDAKHTVFLLKDAQILEEAMLEDINCLLGSGDVPNLFTPDEEADIIVRVQDGVRSTGNPGTRARCMTFFTANVRDCLHIVLCLDPARASFRERVRNFPSLVNCSTIDWYNAWPRAALHSVAHRILGELAIVPNGPQECGVGPKTAASLMKSSVEVHMGVEPAAASFFSQLGRRIYVSPKTYLDFLSTFLNMLRERRMVLSTRLASLQDGVVKLEETGRIVKGLKRELTELQPLLEAKALEAEGLLNQVDEERKEAEAIKDRVARDEAAVTTRQEEISLLQQEAQKNLDQALPALQEAIKALNSLKRDDISEVKSFQNPPQAVQTVMNAVCLLLSEDQDWDSAKRVLSRNSFMDELRHYNKEALTTERRKSLRRYVDDENMSVDRLRKVSLAAAGMCMWVHAMDQYADIFEEVKPRMDTVQVLNRELEQANNVLRTKRNEVQRIEEEVALLMQSGDEANQEKMDLENEIKRCIQRLDRAEKLTSGLEEENKRWTATAQDILDHEVNLTGDIFLSAAFVSYLGAFTGPFRNSLVESWTVILRDKGIRVSDGFSLAQVLVRPVTLREWHLQGLPSDKTSVESAIAATTVATGRWPMLIDPQRQACRWLKHREANQGNDRMTKTTGTGKTNPAMADGLVCGVAGNSGLLSSLLLAVREGASLLVEDIGTNIDPVLDPVLCHRTFLKGGRTMIHLGDVEVEYNSNFRLYLTTELSNPHFQADTAVRVNIINFTVTRRGLEEQLLCEVVTLEQPELEERHHDLVTSIATDQKQLLEIEDQILRLLNEASSGVEVLDDETLITTLSKSKTMSNAIGERLADSKSTKRQIEDSRDCYRPVAVRGSLLYFTVAELCRVDTMYQYSLDYFQLLFTNCIVDTLDTRNGQSARLQLLLEKSTEAVYRAVSRGLFERHKLPFAFMLCTGILRAAGEMLIQSPPMLLTITALAIMQITTVEWMLLLEGARPNIRRRTSRRENDQRVNQIAKNPDSTILDERNWQTLQQAEVGIPAMKGICTSVVDSWSRWQDWRTDASAHRAPLPSGWEEKLNRFQKMIVVRALAEANTHGAAADLVEHHLGRELLLPSGTASGVEEVFADVDESTPCVFILSRGADPMALLLKFAGFMGMESQLEVVSLGKGQGPRAEEVIKVARTSGSWVMLQNCHLACSWLPTLDGVVKSLGCSSGHSKPGFRLFMSAAPVPYFPVGVLQRSVKITDEPPRGIQANLRRSYNMQMSGILNRERKEGIRRPPEWKRLLFGLCFFHAVIQERDKFGPLGWNVTYNFGDSDLDTAFKLLGRFVDDLSADPSTPSLTALPVESLVYVTGNITYGGWVTDEWDRRCLLAVLDHFYSASIFGEAAHMYGGLPSSHESKKGTEDGLGLSKAKARLARRLSASSAMIAAAPVDAPAESYLTYIEHIPPEDGPQMFGMHASADISLRLKESKALLDAVLALQPKDANSSVGQRPDDVVLAVTQELLSRIPGALKHRKEGAVNHLTRRGSSVEPGASNADSLLTVLVQELDNCNSLLEITRTTVQQLVLAVKGEIVMSPELDKVYSQFLVNRVPEEWRRRGFSSLKPLGSWMKDLRWRVRFFELWLERGNPYAFSLPAFFFPQGFLTAVLQNHARKHAVPVNLLGFKYDFPDIIQPEDVKNHPTDGVLVYGMHIEGGSWDHATKRLCDPRPDQMRAPAPIIHFLPETNHKPNSADYICPTYKTPARRGELSTTGISTNFVVAVEFLTDMPVRKFILHGAAMLLSLES